MSPRTKRNFRFPCSQWAQPGPPSPRTQRKSLAEDLRSLAPTPMTTTQALVAFPSAFAVFADRYRRKLVACPEPVCTDTTVTDEESIPSFVRLVSLGPGIAWRQ